MLRLYPEIAWVNNFRLADPGLAVDRPPVLLAPMAAILGSRVGRMAMSSQLMRGILDSIATRLDEARDISRYMTGLLVFLGLLGTFWGLIETVELGRQASFKASRSSGDAGAMFDSLREGLAAPLARHGHFVLVLAVRSCRLARARLPRSADRARRRTASTPSSKTGCPPPFTTQARRAAPLPPAWRRRDSLARSSGCARRSTEARLGQGRDPPPWPISPKRSRAWCTTCAPSSR